MDEFKPNSHKSKVESREKKVSKIVTGDVKVGEGKNGIRAVADAFIKEDAPTVKRYLIFDVLIPAAKRTLLDLITNGARMSLYGSKGGPDNGKGTPGTKYSYSKYYESDYREETSSRYKDRPSYDDIVFSSAGEAEMVLDTMRQTLYEYGVISVLDLFDMLGKECDHTQDKYGWKDLRTASVQPVRDGYWLKLPKPRPI